MGRISRPMAESGLGASWGTDPLGGTGGGTIISKVASGENQEEEERQRKHQVNTFMRGHQNPHWARASRITNAVVLGFLGGDVAANTVPRLGVAAREKPHIAGPRGVHNRCHSIRATSKRQV